MFHGARIIFQFDGCPVMVEYDQDAAESCRDVEKKSPDVAKRFRDVGMPCFSMIWTKSVAADVNPLQSTR
jgi:hypothetical protein